MYQLINENVNLILDRIDRNSHIQPYLWLLNQLYNTDVRNDDRFQQRYKQYWIMNRARLSERYFQRYFSILEENKDNQNIEISNVARLLYQVPTHENSKKSLQFSFATKLVHSINTKSPIFDKMVKQFYFLPESQRNWSFDEKLSNMLSNYQFLSQEYQRVLNQGILSESINSFRERFDVDEQYTDIKIIDSLIWKFVTLLNDGALRTGLIIYT
jgi:hypothetical protein